MNLSDDLSTTQVFRNATSNILKIGNITFVIFTLLYTFNVIMGLPINFYVLWLILMGKGNGIRTQFFSLNLTFCEVLVCLGTICFVVAHEVPDIMPLEGIVGAFALCGRPIFLCLICMERYMAVVHPITFLKCRPLRYRLACTAAVWVIVLGFGVFCILAAKTGLMFLYINFILTMYSLFLSIVLFCCFATIRALKFPGPGQKGKERELTNHMKRKATTVFLMFTVAMVIQYLPLYFAGALYSTLSESSFEILWNFSGIFSFFVGYVHPLHYIQRTGHFSTSCLKKVF